jgi:hypothetical protein
VGSGEPQALSCGALRKGVESAVQCLVQGRGRVRPYEAGYEIDRFHVRAWARFDHPTCICWSDPVI